MVEGPAVTLDDDHAPAVRIDALEMFVDLLARVEEDGSSDAFYGRLCEAACELTSMDRAVIFRYDEAQRRVRAAGTLQPAARRVRGRALHRRERADRAPGAGRGPRPRGAREPRARAARALPRPAARRAARVHADRRQRPLDRRDPLRPPGTAPLSDNERYLLWTIGKVAALADPRAHRDAQPGAARAAAGAHRPRARDPRRRDPAAVRGLDGVLGRPGALGGGARAHRRGAQRRAAGPAARARPPARADVRGRRRRRCAPRSSGSRPAPGARHRARRAAPTSARGARAARAVGADRGGPQRAQARRPDRTSRCRWSGSTARS